MNCAPSSSSAAALAAENQLVCCCFASAVTAVTHSLKFLGANLVELIDNDKN